MPTPKVQVNMSITVEDHALIAQAAANARLPVTTWARGVLLEAAAQPEGPACRTCGQTYEVSAPTGYRYCNCGRKQPVKGYMPPQVG